MDEEFESLQKNGTWSLVKRKLGQKLVTYKWIFEKKEGSTKDEPVKFKARLVAIGYTQIEVLDYNEVFSPIIKNTSIRFLLSLVAQKNQELEQLDVKTTFLHGDLEEHIFMAQLEGYKETGKEDMVCLLRKSLYGLKQSPRQWHKKVDSFILIVGFKRSRYDGCFYYKISSEVKMLFVIYIDDMLLANKSKEQIENLKQILKSKFDMKN